MVYATRLTLYDKVTQVWPSWALGVAKKVRLYNITECLRLIRCSCIMRAMSEYLTAASLG